MSNNNSDYKAGTIRANEKIDLEQYAGALTDLNRFVENSPKPNQSKLELFGVHRHLTTAEDWIEQGKAFYSCYKEYVSAASLSNNADNARVCMLLAKECFEQAMQLDKTFAREYNEAIFFGSKLSDYFAAIEMYEIIIGKCPKCGSHNIAYYEAAFVCHDCGFNRCC
ncbi:MAG: hypothetical protein LBN23_06205 [Paludibacter sp.]|jgi:tetratricopeptide (TPR) repeat protein|nr:hypothetical protein [Paludibacter sp.]